MAAVTFSSSSIKDKSPTDDPHTIAELPSFINVVQMKSCLYTDPLPPSGSFLLGRIEHPLYQFACVTIHYSKSKSIDFEEKFFTIDRGSIVRVGFDPKGLCQLKERYSSLESIYEAAGPLNQTKSAAEVQKRENEIFESSFVPLSEAMKALASFLSAPPGTYFIQYDIDKGNSMQQLFTMFVQNENGHCYSYPVSITSEGKIRLWTVPGYTDFEDFTQIKDHLKLTRGLPEWELEQIAMHSHPIRHETKL
jgi:hypothetical protein